MRRKKHSSKYSEYMTALSNPVASVRAARYAICSRSVRMFTLKARWLGEEKNVNLCRKICHSTINRCVLFLNIFSGRYTKEKK